MEELIRFFILISTAHVSGHFVPISDVASFLLWVSNSIFLNKICNISMLKFLQYSNILVIWRHLSFTWHFLFYSISIFINSIIIIIIISEWYCPCHNITQVNNQYKLMESCTIWRTSVHLWGWNHDSEESEWLVNLGSTTLREPDDSLDDGSSEAEWLHRKIPQIPAAKMQNDWMILLIVHRKTKLTLFPFREVPGTRGLPPAVVFVIMRWGGGG